MIKDNIDGILKRINEACDKCGRDASSVKLLCVSKTKPVEMLEEALNAGMTEFGENYVQELTDKVKYFENAANKPNWHMIGHLQTNKVKFIVGDVKLIHSVDSLKLAETINKEAIKKNLVQNVLIEINIAGEESKTGMNEDEALETIKAASLLSNIHICGLMCMPPLSENPEDSRPYFKKACKLKEQVEALKLPNVDMRELSMGTTGDFEVAIEEGATMVRVGTAIFGHREYNNK